jgi:hypothetical protein
MIWWVSGAMAGACDDVGRALDDAAAALLDVRTTEAEVALREAEDALLICDRPAQPAALGRLWLVEGVLRFVEGDDEAAGQAMAASSRVTPDATWADVYGPKVQARYDKARKAPAWPSTIRLEPELGGNVHWLDGAIATQESTVPSGLHLVQVADPDGSVRFGQIVFLAPAQTLALDTGVPTAPLPARVTPDPVAPLERRKAGPLPWVAVGSGVVGAALMGLSAERYASMQRVESGTALQSSFRTSMGAGVGGLALLGVSGLSVGLHLAR